MKKWLLSIILILICVSSLVINVFLINSLKESNDTDEVVYVEDSHELRVYDDSMSEETFSSLFTNITNLLDENTQAIEDVSNEIKILETKIETINAEANFAPNRSIYLDRDDIYRYLIYMALIGDTGRIEEFNELTGMHYSYEGFQLISDSLRIMFPPNHHLRISVSSGNISIVDADTYVMLNQRVDTENGYGFNGGIAYLDFMYYGIDSLCISINSSDAEILMNTFGEDGIDDIETALDVLEEVTEKFVGEVEYQFLGMESDENLYQFELSDGTNSYIVETRVAEGSIGIFEFGDLLE